MTGATKAKQLLSYNIVFNPNYHMICLHGLGFCVLPEAGDACSSVVVSREGADDAADGTTKEKKNH